MIRGSGSPLYYKMIRIVSGSSLQNLLKESSLLRDRTKYDIKLHNDVYS